MSLYNSTTTIYTKGLNIQISRSAGEKGGTKPAFNLLGFCYFYKVINQEMHDTNLIGLMDVYLLFSLIFYRASIAR